MNNSDTTRFSNDKIGRDAFDAQRLRNLAKVLGVDSAIPSSDEELLGVIGVVCGIYYRKIKQLQKEIKDIKFETIEICAKECEKIQEEFSEHPEAAQTCADHIRLIKVKDNS